MNSSITTELKPIKGHVYFKQLPLTEHEVEPQDSVYRQHYRYSARQ
jgi:hypothetical protein